MVAFRQATTITACIGVAGAAGCVAFAQDNSHDPLVIGAAWVLGAVGAISGLLAIGAPKPVTKQEARDIVRDVDRRSAERDLAAHGKLDSLTRMVEALAASQSPDAPTPDAQIQAAQEKAISQIEASNDPLDEKVKRAVEAGDVDLAIAALLDAATQDTKTAARRYRDAGLFAYGRDVDTAIEAFRGAVRLDPESAWTHIYLCRLYDIRGDSEAALSEAQAALATAIIESDRGSALNDLGDIQLSRGNLPAAQQAYEDALVIAKKMASQNPNNTDWARDLSVSHNKIGDMARQAGNLQSARQSYEECREIHQTLVAADPENTEWNRDLSVSYERLGDLARQEDDFDGARKFYEDSLQIRKSLTDRDVNNTEWQRDVSVIYNKIGDLARRTDNHAAALKAHQDSLAIAKTLAAKDPKNAEWQRDLSISFERLGDTAEAIGDIANAIAHYRDSEPIAERLAQLAPTHAGFQNDLRITRRRIAELEAKLPPTA